ncbi:Ig-like domain-containing protein [Mesorhizobium sp. RIZ17]|uniref:Ig-like domain-containing protein n=1 Tax=Mesorhizobium sp. RIZ17 TaxID=3132743 RepID=UPI003DA97E20
MAEGSRIEWTNLSGGAANLQSVYQFFGSLGSTAANALFDPRAVYDSVNNRYVVTMDNIGSNGAISNIDIAVSKDSNPNDGWYFYSLNTSLTINGQLTAADQPILSLDGTNIYITAPQYDVNVSGFAGTEEWVISDTAGTGGGLYNGGTMTVVASQLAAPGQGISRVVAGNNGQTYYASAVNTGSQTLITLQTYSLATNSFGAATTVSLGNIDQGGGGADFTAQQQGTSIPLDAGDGHLQNLAYANGFLYGVFEVKPVGSSTPQVHWFKLDVSNPSSPVLVAQGNISGASIGAGVATFDGSIAVDQAGDVVINFTASGPNMYPADYYSFLAAGDPSGTFSAPVLYQASASYLADGDGPTVQRWGTYSTAIADPNQANSFWLSSEYSANGWWQTAVAQVAIQAPNATVTERLLNDTGASPSDNITSSAALTGTGSANAVVHFTVDGSPISSTVTASSTGAWTFTPTGLADGQHTIIASETDALGNPSSASLTFTLDTTLPTVTITNAGGTATQPTLTVTGTVSDPDVSGPGTTVAIFDGTAQVATATVQANGSWSTNINLTNGTNSLTARDTDLAGNVGISAPVTYTYQGATSQITTLFSGISDTSSDPPHNALAVGPSYIVMAEGSRIEWTNLSGGAANLQSVYQFFGSLGSTAANALFDPRAVYDSVNNRYVVTMDNIGSNGAISNIDIAVSKDSNPNDGWYFYSLNTSLTINGQLTAADQPILSLDGTNIYITAPQYDVNVSGFAGTEEWVISDTAGTGGGLYNGGTMTVVASQLAAPNQGMTRVVAGNNGQTYYASAIRTSSQTLITLQTYSLATNSFGAATTVSLGSIDQGDGGVDFTAQQQGTSIPLDAGDGHLQNLAYANGFLYGVFEVKPVGSSTPQVHWFKLDVSNPSSPVLVAQGNISGASIGAGVATFDGSIAADQAGDVVINFTASGPNMYPADYYSFLAAGDPSGAFSAPVLYQASASYLANGDSATLQRWGIYSTAIADPNHANSFWLSSEYSANGWWQTAVAQVAIQSSTPAVTERLLNDTGASSGDTITKDATLTGTGSANTVVHFTVDGTPISSTVTANSTGAWTFTPTGLADGQHTIIASETDALGNPSSASLTFTLDTTLPAVAITNAGGTATQPTLTVTGTVSDPDISGPGATVAIFDGTAQVATATVQANGSWSTNINLTNGTNSLTARDTDLAGNVGISAPVTYTYQGVPQGAPDHVVVVMEENHSYSEIIGNSAAPYINSLASQGTLFTNYYAVSHPSEPNYFAIFSGSTQGITTDGSFFFPTTPTLAGELAQAGDRFVGYAESPPDQDHDPWASFGDSQNTGQDFSQFPTDFSTLPTVSFVAPNINDDMHTGTIAQGDQWLSSHLSAYANWATTHNSILVVAFDEDDGTSNNHVATLVFGAGVGAGQNSQLFDHYSLLHTIENMYNLPALGSTGTAPIMTFAPVSGAPTIASIATSGTGITNGTGDLNAGKIVTLTVNFSAAVTVNTTGGSPQLLLNDGGIATYSGGSGTTALTFSYAVASGQNTSDLTVSSFSLNGSTITDPATNNANLAGATNYNPAGTLQIDTTVPTIAINTIAGNNNVNALEALTGFAISGTSTNVENGQVVTVNIVNSQNVVVDSYTTSDQNNAWSMSVTSAQAQALADGAYTVTADVADKAGNLAPLATKALIVDEDNTPEAPILTIANTALTVQARSSVALGITATPVDSDDSVTLKIAGLPSYETISAPSGYHVSKALQLNGTYTWTITETSSTVGKPISGLTLASSYKGTNHPVATLTVTASNSTAGETASAPSRTMTVTDPPATTTNPTSNLLALFNQYAAWGFHDGRANAGEIAPAWSQHGGNDVLAMLTTPGHFGH